MKNKFYILKVELMDIKPEIWRRFVVPENITLDRLADVIWIVMGWQGYHRYEFEIGQQRYVESPEDVPGIPGYERACEIVNTPGHEEYEDFKAWYEETYGGYFDPDYFEVTEVNKELDKYTWWSKR